ncbi:MAG: SpoVR family protein [Candidatus Yanofskybacteria bacterium]|nr:SpoVR family protein [Candidatus Yanofskybacteria bacterium]
MELIDQKTKKIMEECRVRATAAGLQISGETLEYIVTNRDLLELSPKVMIPTLYDFWVNDAEAIGNKWIYGAYPHNPYETVINTRPAISFYNDNNPDWLNVMIFYHVLGHIDFFQNNATFKKTWDDDFSGQALADKRLLNRIREEMGAKKRWVDYVVEFARSLDNLVGFHEELEEADRNTLRSVLGTFSEKANFYFGKFLKQRYDQKNVGLKFYHDEMERYNLCLKEFGQKLGEAAFFDDYKFKSKFPEFNSVFKKHQEKKEKAKKPKDILQFLMENSAFINKEENKWMKDVLQIVRRTSLFFQPQIRTKICNEGWASLWHNKLFIVDEKMSGHEVDFARVNSGVLLDPKIGLNPYITGMRIFEFIEELAEKGKLSYEYQLLKDAEQRKRFDLKLGSEIGKKALFEARENLDDSLLINFLSDDDFQDFVDKHNLFIAGTRLNMEKEVVEVYIKSRDGKKYRKMLNKILYHPPYYTLSDEEGELYFNHIFEGRALVTKYVPAVLRGLAYLWNGKIKLETTEFEKKPIMDLAQLLMFQDGVEQPESKKSRVLYTCEKNNVSRTVLDEGGK